MAKVGGTVRGRVIAVGLLADSIAPEDRAAWGLGQEARLILIEVDPSDPGDVPMGTVWAEAVDITIRTVVGEAA
jgi:hypothetical protein